ncbi:MAG: hypothetical protein GWP19_00430 [Planctomycetia bacterium]|nr:hypothetical protein [Planctomycetia bacterium]
MRKIKNIIIHCSDSEFGDAKLIRKWHTEPPRNWRDIGYSFVICNGHRKSSKQYDINTDGLIEAGRSLDNDIYLETGETGAHAYGFNTNSIGLCLIGKTVFTPKQFQSLYYIVMYYKRMIPDINVIGHYEVSDHKTCPNIDMHNFRLLLDGHSLNDDIRYYLSDYI